MSSYNSHGSVVPPTPPPPPPKVITPRSSSGRRLVLTRDASERSESNSYYDDDVCPMEETPLIAHGSRKKSKAAVAVSSSSSEPPVQGTVDPFHQSAGQPQYYHRSPRMKPKYSAIPENKSKTFSRSGSRSASVIDDEDDDDDKLLNNDDDNMELDDDDDRSISTTDSISSFSTVSSLAENFRDSLLIPFTDDEGTRQKIISGLAALAVIGTLLGIVMPKSYALTNRTPVWYHYLSSIIGYNYFALWSCCFYPQVMLNYRRKSTKGLSADFACLNLMGWTFYALYLSSMYFDRDIRQLYAERFHESSTVASNDVAFAIHAAILSVIYLAQIQYYGKDMCSIRLKPQTWALILGMGLPAIAMPLLIQCGIWSSKKWLEYFYILSFFKIGCTLTKYSKQVMFNYKRKSTRGWNIWYNFLECSGGSLSMIQIVLDSFALKNMTGITGNLAKFALGFATLFFDFVFFMQHYVWYPEPKEDDYVHLGEEEEEEGGGVGVGGVPKTLPKHVRASSRFEIVIPGHHIDVPTNFGGSNSNNNNTMPHANSELSFDSKSEDGLGLLT